MRRRARGSGRLARRIATFLASINRLGTGFHSFFGFGANCPFLARCGRRRFFRYILAGRFFGFLTLFAYTFLSRASGSFFSLCFGLAALLGLYDLTFARSLQGALTSIHLA
jgi:hypothetical protein